MHPEHKIAKNNQQIWDWWQLRPIEVELQVAYFGVGTPVILRPDWIDRIVSSSVLIALIGVMTFASSIFQIFMFARSGRNL